MGRVTERLTGLVGLILVLSADGCVAKMYAGPARPASDTVLLEPNKAEIQSLDGRDLRTRSRLAILPGAHAVLVKTTLVGHEEDATSMVCFWAEAGHRYEIRPGKLDFGWRAAIVDEATGTALPTFPGALDHDCLPELTAHATSSSWAAEVAAEPPAPPMLVGRPVHRIGNGVWLEVGLFLGGTEVPPPSYGSNTVDGGDGTSMAIGVTVTPLWAGNVAGLGLDAFAGVKYANPSSGVSLTRYPVGLGAHVLLHVAGDCGLLLRGGIQKEEGISLSLNGSNTDLAGSLGWFGEGGIYCGGDSPMWAIPGGFGAVAVTFRYSDSSDSGYGSGYRSINSNIGSVISANSGGVVLGTHFNVF